MKTVYIIGSKGIPAKYGGFETFVDKLTAYQTDKEVSYYVACMRENSAKSGLTEDTFTYNGATCFNVDVPNIGPARAIFYDVIALKKAIAIAEKNGDEAPLFYVLACRIGPFISEIKKKIEEIGGTLWVNPDGHEWLREKWSWPIRKYWKYSERLMVKHADWLICDSKTIETYIQTDYRRYKPKTTYIAYGTELSRSSLSATDSVVRQWFDSHQLSENNYYLVVGRFVPENNYEAMIREFMASRSQKEFVLITNVEQNAFYNRLKKETEFETDVRIKFVGTVYDQELLKYIRENAFAYIHGHEVGGTNPSLLEALASTPLNLLLDVGFNREVASDSAFYWQKENLHQLIEQVENLSASKLAWYEQASTKEVATRFSWEMIVDQYQTAYKENR